MRLLSKAKLLFEGPTNLILIAVAALSLGFTVAWVVSANQHRSLMSVACPAHTTCVALKSGSASPDSLSVVAGDYVQFNSADNKIHNLSLGSGDPSHAGHEASGSLASGDIKADEGWKVQFKNPGTYQFQDKYSPNTKILVVAYTPGGDYKIK